MNVVLEQILRESRECVKNNQYAQARDLLSKVFYRLGANPEEPNTYIFSQAKILYSQITLIENILGENSMTSPVEQYMLTEMHVQSGCQRFDLKGQLDTLKRNTLVLESARSDATHAHCWSAELILGLIRTLS